MNDEGSNSRAEATLSAARTTTALRPLAALRSATADAHRRLEALPSQTRLLSDDYPFGEYRALLERMYGVHEPLAAALRAAEPSGTWSGRAAARTAALRCDLLELGVDADDELLVPRCSALPRLDTPDRVLGCAYVLEGSQLGARVIYRHLRAVFAAQPVLPVRFFSADGDQAGSAWRSFCAAVDAQVADIDAVCRAACSTFDAVHRWLDSTPSAPAVTA